ncbi:type IX secretion system outer membrane channel protein PorV [Flavobacterium agricola]|uniref:Type IX secretion system outer membrane channel protein PorV n=1 Tax=Flavobacterium agricola TaxID=2870839 RepID=A0ABY6LZM4_9FLAO|nr:type IX secretion system outer membrane channel protein PorV [Flavobacterium agricola]UYW01472.1 type IX secretion system outer membrane channel protein PorV [Flavobacterium agricola]
MKKTYLVFISVLTFAYSYAQYYDPQSRVITTGVPFLLINADARAAGMGDIGAASTADVYSQQHNPAKYAFAEDEHGVGISYTPYLTNIANDISLSQLNYYYKINERSAFATSLRYFGLGDIELRDTYEDVGRVVRPNELAFDVSYSLKLDQKFSMAVAGRYIRSSLKVPNGNNDASAANAFAFDIAAYYQSEEIAYRNFNGRWRAGLTLQNMGPKIAYDDDKTNEDFLPANMKLGVGFDFIFDEQNKITALGQINKLLVPTPLEVKPNANGDITPTEIQAANQAYKEIGWVSGIFKSFTDAPGGFSEKMKELSWSLGAEYWYQDSFAFRAGYYNENVAKGARQYATIGAGFKYNIARVDVSYLFSTSNVRNPLENTLRFSLTLNFGDKYTNY